MKVQKIALSGGYSLIKISKYFIFFNIALFSKFLAIVL
ncbi:hypothetical protein HMPREF1145_1913 [Oribacterium parvum ACB8]|nr:hypothetical protein HMPREF1145_1913 [Oribacterium parvum ACB8]